MKRKAIIAIAVAVLIALIVAALPAMAAKPQNAGKDGTMDVIEKSNGFPSGPHFNLNIHGKDPATFTCPDEDPYFEGWGNSVFIDIDGTTTIYYMTCKKSSVDVLNVIDGCGVFDGSVTIQLPKIPDGLPLEDQGYHVFARILGKPNNRKTPEDPEDTRSYIFLSPNTVDDLCNEPQGSDEEGWYCDSELSLGLILKDAVYGDDGQAFYRFDDPQGQGRGKSKALDITQLFTFTGWVIDARLDNYSVSEGWGYSDGAITVGDIPVYDWDCDGGSVTADNRDVDGDTSENPDLAATDDDDLDMYLNYMAGEIVGAPACWLYCLGYELNPVTDPMAWYFEDAWILNIAEFVLTEGTIENDGAKLLQIRFYPRWTTEYVLPE
jgi:hypothetical protein